MWKSARQQKQKIPGRRWWLIILQWTTCGDETAGLEETIPARGLGRVGGGVRKYLDGNKGERAEQGRLQNKEEKNLPVTTLTGRDP